MIGVAVLGSTGSVGESTLDVLARHPERFRLVAVAANSNAAKLARQVLTWRPAYAALADEGAAADDRDQRAHGDTSQQTLPGLARRHLRRETEAPEHAPREECANVRNPHQHEREQHPLCAVRQGEAQAHQCQPGGYERQDTGSGRGPGRHAARGKHDPAERQQPPQHRHGEHQVEPAGAHREMPHEPQQHPDQQHVAEARSGIHQPQER